MTAPGGLFSEAVTQQMPEPPDGAYVLVGDTPSQTLYVRDDEEAKDCDWGEAHWFDAADGNEPPEEWGDLVRLRPQRMYLRDDLPLSVAEALDAAERVTTNV